MQVPPAQRPACDDWRPSISLDVLRLRAGLLRKVRSFFEERGFLEVETPLLSSDVVVDLHLEPFAVPDDSGSGEMLWLQTSPEFGMKRLLAAGSGSIFQITRAFRKSEIGPLHNREFTIVEWYAVAQDFDGGMQLLSDLCRVLLQQAPAARLSYREAFTRYAGVDPVSADPGILAEAVRAAGLAMPGRPDSMDKDAWLDLLLVELVQPHLGNGSPTILHDYPPTQAALAQVRAGDPPVAERFELFLRGIELANGYHELLDPAELLRRARAQNQARAAHGKPVLPEESRLLAAMEHGLPGCTGVALGFDRVVMLAAEAGTLAEVLPFPGDRA